MRPLLALALLSGCEVILHVDAARTAETSDALCSDGLDNDANGLADCQDFQCLGTAPCCTLPTIVIDEAFDAACSSQPCNAATTMSCLPDPNHWLAWGAPFPVECEGTLHVPKTEICYDVGLLVKDPVTIHPGLSITVDLDGTPEVAGRLLVALTDRSQVGGGQEPCVPIDPLQPALSAQIVPTVHGLQVVAVQIDEIGSSPEVSDGPHQVRLEVDGSRRVSFSLDGKPFASTQPLPADTPLHLALAGRSLNARFAHARIVDGTQCEAPGAWTSPPFLALAPGVPGGGDSLHLRRPFVQKGATMPGGPEIVTGLIYTGCDPATLAPDVCGDQYIIGQATLPAGTSSGTFTRTGPLLMGPADDADFTAVRFHDGSGASPILFYVSSPARGVFQVGREVVNMPGYIQVDSSGILESGPFPDWQQGGACCGGGLRLNGRYQAWATAFNPAHTSSRIAYYDVSDDGVTFTRYEQPALAEGGLEDPDARGVSDPDVLYDDTRNLYRMWYVMHGPLGGSAIGYAVSTDGQVWHKFPGNPVVTGEQLGLESIGSPAVLPAEDRLRMWLHGRDMSDGHFKIYAIENPGVPPAH